MSEEQRKAFLACTRGDLAILQSLVPSKVDVNSAIFQWQVSGINCRHLTLLHVAAGCSQTGVIPYLLINQANPNQIDLLRRTPLHYAAQTGNDESVRLLLQEGANVNAEDSSKFTALHIAANRGDVSKCEILLSKGANINAIDDTGALIFFPTSNSTSLGNNLTKIRLR